MTDSERVLYEVILSGVVALVVSLITTRLSLRDSSKNYEFHSAEQLLNKIHRAINTRSPGMHEETVTCDGHELALLLKNSEFFDGASIESVNDRLTLLKYQYTELTREGLATQTLEGKRVQARATVESIRKCVREKYRK